ncbi:MAG: DNA sulfur modification protein DndD [Candidatus Kapabacteria bacterium]|jgi:DNA sulfur modification protein DndD|nr:DNA sulfur modification protein DndD [Candidatus Kapabacteria bacterium]
MNIESVTLHNFKSFLGTHTIGGLTTGLSRNKRIILFGGLNGAGKTTFLEAILLCLYGKRNRNLFPSKGAKREDYQHYIVAMMNDEAKRDAVQLQMSIEIQLGNVEIGNILQDIIIKRSWGLNSNNHIRNEEFTIRKVDGSSFEITAQDEYESFIEELLPYDVSQFFFFDGEKIQDFVKDEDEAFADALEKILGISVYRTLIEDLATTKSRILTGYKANQGIKKRIAEIDAEIAESEEKIIEAQEKMDTLQSEIQNFQDRLNVLDRETQRITRIDADTAEGFRDQREELRTEKKFIEETVGTAISSDLPILMMARLLKSVFSQLSQEEKISEYRTLQKVHQPKINNVIERIFFGDIEAVPPLLERQKQFYVDALREVLNDTFIDRQPILDSAEMLHDITKSDEQRIVLRARQSFETLSRFKKQITRLNEINTELIRLEKKERLTRDSQVEKLFEEKGKIKAEIDIKEREIREIWMVQAQRNRDEIQALRKERTNKEESAKATDSMQRQIEYCDKVRDTLEIFLHDFRVSRVERLEEFALKTLKKLARKKDQFSSLKIDAEKQFAITLYSANGDAIDKTKLSAGEKELLAISLIYALSQITDRSLPIVIDTPLARLDSQHRAQIAKHYFANAGEQVILLSTDEEVVRDTYEVLKPHIAQTYMINKDTARQTARVVRGQYFQQ